MPLRPVIVASIHLQSQRCKSVQLAWADPKRAVTQKRTLVALAISPRTHLSGNPSPLTVYLLVKRMLIKAAEKPTNLMCAVVRRQPYSTPPSTYVTDFSAVDQAACVQEGADLGRASDITLHGGAHPYSKIHTSHRQTLCR